MLKWEQGRAEIEMLLEKRHLQEVMASREHADRLLAQARRHLVSAQVVAADDPEGGYALLYDAARKSLAAVLENQGLRATSSGGHLAIHQAVSAQLDPPMGHLLRPFDRMRRARREVEYPRLEDPEPTAEGVLADVTKVEAILRVAGTVVDSMPRW